MVFGGRLKLKLSNAGFLPTHGAERAVATKAVREHGLASLQLPEGMTLLSGERMTEVPHLQGRAAAFDSESPVASSYGASPVNAHEAHLEWIVHGSGAVEVEVDFQRGGVHRCAVRVGAEAKL